LGRPFTRSQVELGAEPVFIAAHLLNGTINQPKNPLNVGLIPGRNQTGGTGVSPVQAQAKACGYKKLFERNSVREDFLPSCLGLMGDKIMEDGGVGRRLSPGPLNFPAHQALRAAPPEQVTHLFLKGFHIEVKDRGDVEGEKLGDQEAAHHRHP